MRTISRFLIGLALLVPVAASAQTAEELKAQAQALLAKVQQLQAQLGTGGVTGAGNVTLDSSSCPLIGRSLKLGASGDDVTRLQQFLARDPSIYPEGRVTGYYGALTESAVKRWQVKYNIVSTGTAESTGYGVVGPRTAAAISLLCTTGGYGGGATPGNVGGFIQVTPVSGNAPLTVAVQATVNTVNSCTGATYILDYGDGTQPAQIAVPAGNCAQMTQTLGHTYPYGGSYVMTLSSGVHRTSATVVVNGPAAPTGPIPAPPPPQNSWVIVSVIPLVNNNPLAVTLEIEYPAGSSYRIDWGDNSSPSSGGGSGSSGSASLNHTYATDGTYVISLKDSGNAVKATSAISISD